MTVVTVRPDDNVTSGTITVDGAGTVHAALNDDSDSSYVTIPMAGDGRYALARFPAPARPSGAVLKRVAARARVAKEVAAPGAAIEIMLLDGITGGVGDPAVSFSPTTSPTTATVLTADGENTALEADPSLRFKSAVGPVGGGGSPFEAYVYEAYVDFTYVEQPEASATAPSGTVSDTSMPTVEWDAVLDSDGGDQTHYEVKVFTAAQYGAGGFDPDTSTPAAESDITTGTAVSWQSASLSDGAHRAYVRVAQTVNGEQHWSEWDYVAFTMDVAIPGEPTLDLEPDAPNGVIEITLVATAGDVVADAFQVERSDDDGETWTAVRTTTGDGIVAAVDEEATLWDAEAPNGDTATYRARALTEAAGGYVASDWVEQESSWSSTDQWLKYPAPPTLGEGGFGGSTYGTGIYGSATYGARQLDSLNLQVRVHAYAGHRRASRQGVFQPLGRSTAVVVSDTRGPATGAVVLIVDTDADRDLLDYVLDAGSPLLLQMADGDERPDRWVVFADHERAAILDKSFIATTLETLTWTEVPRPD